MNETMEHARIWSPYQQAIFEFIESSRSSLLVEAVAGSGKTTTIVEAIRHVPSTQSVAFLAFNKSIAEELKRRVTSPHSSPLALCTVLSVTILAPSADSPNRDSMAVFSLAIPKTLSSPSLSNPCSSMNTRTVLQVRLLLPLPRLPRPLARHVQVRVQESGHYGGTR